MSGWIKEGREIVQAVQAAAGDALKTCNPDGCKHCGQVPLRLLVGDPEDVEQQTEIEACPRMEDSEIVFYEGHNLRGEGPNDILGVLVPDPAPYFGINPRPEDGWVKDPAKIGALLQRLGRQSIAHCPSGGCVECDGAQLVKVVIPLTRASERATGRGRTTTMCLRWRSGLVTLKELCAPEAYQGPVLYARSPDPT